MENVVGSNVDIYMWVSNSSWLGALQSAGRSFLPSRPHGTSVMWSCLALRQQWFFAACACCSLATCKERQDSCPVAEAGGNWKGSNVPLLGSSHCARSGGAQSKCCPQAGGYSGSIVRQAWFSLRLDYIVPFGQTCVIGLNHCRFSDCRKWLRK